MNSKAVIAIAVVVVLAAAGIGAFALLRDKGSSDSDTFDGVDLKVLGNVNKDGVIDNNDLEELKKGVSYEWKAKDHPLADANNDGKINEDDIAVVKAIIDGTSTKVWHVNFHDTDGDGVMDNELVETAWPVKSAITTGSANTFMMLYLLGIVDEIKGASYGSTNDTYLFKDNYISGNKDICQKLGTSSTSIEFENGKIGSSDIIAEKNVTCVLSDWNRTYLTNEKAFEEAHVDVVRIAAASFDKDTYTHSILLLGFLFQKNDNASAVLKYYNDAKESIDKVISNVPEDKKAMAAASSMNGYLSSGDSDYTAIAEYAGAGFALKGFDFGGSSSIKVADNLGVYKYENWDYILHIRTSMSYAQVTDSSAMDKIYADWASYTSAFKEWKNAEKGQYFVSGVIPVPARVAYAAYAMYGDIDGVGATKDWADGIHQSFVGQYAESKKNIDVKNYAFVFNNKPLYTISGCSKYYNGSAYDAVTFKAISKDVTVQYRLSESEEWSSTMPKVTEVGSTKVYYKVSCPGFDSVESVVTAEVWHAKLDFTVTAYTGVADGTEHPGVTVTINDPALADKFKITYGESSSNLGNTCPTYKDAGEYKVYWKITPKDSIKAEHWKTESGNVTAKITAAS